MKENKSPGVVGISPKILKETVEQISTPLAHVFNMSLQEGIVPFERKEANIIPLFKKGSRNKSVNYRPVSLISVICILLETIIRDHMMDFLIKHKPDVPRRLALSNFEHLVSLSSEHRTHRQTDGQLKTLYGSLSKL